MIDQMDVKSKTVSKYYQYVDTIKLKVVSPSHLPFIRLSPDKGR